MNKTLKANKPASMALILLALLLLLMLPSSGRAMSSAGYRLDWFTPMTGTGAAASSPNFSLHLTVGQTVTGLEGRPGYALNLGYWQNWNGGQQFLPIVARP